MKNDIITFYDDTCDNAKFDEAKQDVFNSFADSQGWTDISEVPNDMVWTEIHDQNTADWEYFSEHLKRLLKEHYYLITGTCGRWNGTAECGNFIKDYDDFTAFIRHLDNLKIYELNGHLYISGYHHDGHDSYEMKRLTDRGVQYADRQHIEYGIDDYLYIVAGAWNGNRTYHKLKVHYGKCDYILFNGRRCRLNEFIRN